MEKILVSRCLLGENVKYNGGNNLLKNPILQRWISEGRIVPVCPEVEGGLPTPRDASEIQGDKVVNLKGKDVTKEFVLGAQEACKKATASTARFALLKQSSPSCGSKAIYDGSFKGTKISGKGIAAKMLTDMGIKVFDENEIELLDNLIDK